MCVRRAAFGSNVFNCLFALGTPLLCKALATGRPVPVSTRGVLPALAILCALFVATSALLVATRLRLTAPIGWLFLGAYLGFVLFCFVTKAGG